MKYLSKAIKFIGIIFLLVLIYYTAHIFTSLELKEKIFKTFIELELIEEQDIFWTSEEYRKRLGVEIVALPPEEEQKLHLMIEQYYETKYISEIEEFYKEELFKKDLPLSVKEWYKERISLLPQLKILKIEFSRLRKYRGLKNRIGIITYISKIDPSDFFGGYPMDIFIFKWEDKRWTLERRWNIDGSLEDEEWYFITHYLNK